MEPSHKEVGTKTPRCSVINAFRIIFFTDCTLLRIQLGLKYMYTV